MIFFYLLMPLIVFVPAGIYFYHFFKRFLSLFGLDETRKITKILSILFPILCALAGWRIYDIGAVIVLHFLICCLVMELLNFIFKKIHLKEKAKRIWTFIYKSGIASVLIICILMAYGYVNMHNVYETTYSFQSPKKLDRDVKIAQISDLHMGNTMNADKLHEYCNKVQLYKPDLLMLTGDIFDERTSKEDMIKAIHLLASIKTTYGAYYVWGNHDPNQYTANPYYTMDELRNELKQSGIIVLEDESYVVNSQITVIGRVDSVVNAQRKSIQELLKGVNHNSYLILLDHRPLDLEENAAAGIDLQLSGHTHAGQIWPTGQLGELVGATEKNYGDKMIDDFHAVVSSGIAGWGYPIRTGGHSEYVLIDVKK